MRIVRLCEAFKLSRQTYYDAGKRKVKEEKIGDFIKHQVKKRRKRQSRIGGRKLHYLLADDFKEAGIKVGRNKFFRILREEHLLVKRKKNRAITTRTYKRFRAYSNLIQELEISKQEQVWVSDITYVNCEKGPLYLSIVTDAYSKKIMGYNLSEDMKTQSTMKALEMALRKREYVKRKLIHHSDRGFQYTSKEYTKALKKEEIGISMTTKYDPYENAIAERVNGILKDEFEISDRRIPREQIERIVKNAIEIYNEERPHMSCELLTPNQAHRRGKYKLRKWSRYKYSKN